MKQAQMIGILGRAEGTVAQDNEIIRGQPAAEDSDWRRALAKHLGISGRTFEASRRAMKNEKRFIWRILCVAVASSISLTTVHIGPALAEQLSGTDPVTESGPPPHKQDTAPAEEGKVEERGVPLPGVPSTATVPFQLVGPTENITKVINSMRLKHKSLTIVITTAPGLQLTQPVEISILYISPAPPPPGGNRITQSYQRKFGNRIIYNDAEWEGTPRHVRMDLWITEPKPEGGRYSYSMTWQADLDPVYDITLGPLLFELLSDCDFIGNSEIRFKWAPPDARDGWNRFSFTTTKGRRIWIQQFAWSRVELTTTTIAAQKLHLPAILWTEHDPQLGTDYDSRPTWEGNLPNLPGRTQLFDFKLWPGKTYPGPNEAHAGVCIAHHQYQLTYNLRQYPNL